jgi:hypothetical protein
VLPESLPQRMKNARAGWEARSSVLHDLLAHTLLLFIFQRGTLIPVLAAPWWFLLSCKTSFACLADNGTTLWSINFGPSVPTADLVPPCPGLGQEIGILGTPVIDPTTNTIYLMPFIVESGAQSYR